MSTDIGKLAVDRYSYSVVLFSSPIVFCNDSSMIPILKVICVHKDTYYSFVVWVVITCVQMVAFK